MARRIFTAATLVTAIALAAVAATGTASAETYVPISGAGSTWTQNAIEQWRKNVNQYGLRVNYAGTGSSDGRNQFRNGTVDFAVSDIPYGLTDGGTDDPAPTRGYTYLPVAAGGTSFMYNLSVGGERVTALRLSGSSLARIFTRGITSWADPQIAAENPGLALPDIPVIPVVRGDGAGSTAQFTAWLASQHTAVWDAHCEAAGRPLVDGHCGQTSVFPATAGYVVQAGSLGTAGYVSQDSSAGTITYVEASYALNTGFPVAKMLNSAGYFVGPTPTNVGVALLDAGVRTDVPESDPAYGTADLEGVYTSTDPRSYPLSGYSYLIAPTAAEGDFTAEKGRSLGAFTYYALCEGQQVMPQLGFGLLPANVVAHGLDQVKRIPGVDATSVTLAGCSNPTLAAGADALKASAPMPAACDRAGPLQCGTALTTIPAPATRDPARFSLASTYPFVWGDVSALGAVSYDVRSKAAGLAGSWITRPVATTSGTRMAVPMGVGTTVCASVRARNVHGDTGAWSPYRCQSRAADDRALKGVGWLRTKRAGAYVGTVTATTVLRRQLTVSVVASRIAVVATRCPSCGEVRVYNGALWMGTIDLRASTTRFQSVIPLPQIGGGWRTVTLRVATSGKRVEIDGLAAYRA